MIDQYAVMGHPVSHSKSPRIHAAFAAQTGADLQYTAIEVQPGTFAARAREFFAAGGKGLNITVPFKQEAWELADVHAPEAAAAGAVNTLFQAADGKLHGHNTDGIGLVRDIVSNHGGVLKDASLLILGAGGATRGILLPILLQLPASIVIANRTARKAAELAELFQDQGDITGGGYDALAGQSFDWIINATAASLQGELPPLPAGILRAKGWCYDLMYAQEPTVFCRWATQQGAAHALDGLGMLVEQAAEAFRIWRGISPDTAPVLAELREM
jgi:shikimate dehydrogenase